MLTPDEQAGLMADPVALQILLDLYHTGKLVDDPWKPRVPTLKAQLLWAPVKAHSMNLGDINGLDYRRAQKYVRTYEKHIKGWHDDD